MVVVGVGVDEAVVVAEGRGRKAAPSRVMVVCG